MTRDMTRNAKCSAVKALVAGFESRRLHEKKTRIYTGCTKNAGVHAGLFGKYH